MRHTWFRDVHCLHYLYQLIACNYGQKKDWQKKTTIVVFSLFVCLFLSFFLASICNWATVYKVNLSVYIYIYIYLFKLLHANVYMWMYTLSYSLVRARPPPLFVLRFAFSIIYVSRAMNRRTNWNGGRPGNEAIWWPSCTESQLMINSLQFKVKTLNAVLVQI